MPPSISVLCIVGTRPEAIKTAPVVRALRRRGVPTAVCLTGQHPVLAAEALEDAGLCADFACHLDGPATPSSVRGAVAPVLGRVRPDTVLVQGDTSSALGGALAARAAHVPVFHVEAGLRSHDLLAPFPEELYRVVIDHMSKAHFAPTVRARSNLLAEAVPDGSIHVTGNPGVDALHSLLADLGPPPPRERLLLATAHRRENLGAPLQRVALALDRIAAEHPDHELLVPLHPHPEARRPFAALRRPNVHTLPPLSYRDFVQLLRRARLVLSDSGGVQEEAPVLGTPLLVLRETTERPEVVDAGTARLVGTDTARIVDEACRVLGDPVHRAAMSVPHSPYGDGSAAQRIAGLLQQQLEPERRPRP